VAGYREFVTGEVLTAANVDDFLAKQAVMKFADSAARDTALGTAVGGGNALREGMVAYLDDEDLPSFYDGTQWTTEFGGGGLVAVKHALFTGTQTNSTAAGANFAVTDLSITHTLADAANKLIISAYIGAAATSFDRGNVGLAVFDGSSRIGVGDSDGSRSQITAGGWTSETGSNRITNSLSAQFVYEPGDTTSRTYTVRAVLTQGSTQTVYINRSETDDNNENSVRASSGFVVQEIKV